jgi:peptide/nickel transport system permease protein
MAGLPPNDTHAPNAPASSENPLPPAEDLLLTTQAEERISVASNWTLVWWRFRKNKLAVASVVVLLFLLSVVLVPDFYATADPEETNARLAFIPIQGIHWLDEGQLKPWVPGVAGKRDPVTLKMVWAVDETKKIYIRFFSPGYP